MPHFPLTKFVAIINLETHFGLKEQVMNINVFFAAICLSFSPSLVNASDINDDEMYNIANNLMAQTPIVYNSLLSLDSVTYDGRTDALSFLLILSEQSDPWRDYEKVEFVEGRHLLHVKSACSDHSQRSLIAHGLDIIFWYLDHNSHNFGAEPDVITDFVCSSNGY